MSKFKNIKARCVICNTPLQGQGLKKLGTDYYCSEHYEIEMEKVNNQQIDEREKTFKKIFK